MNRIAKLRRVIREFYEDESFLVILIDFVMNEAITMKIFIGSGEPISSPREMKQTMKAVADYI